jgi:GTP-binding protein LepA
VSRSLAACEGTLLLVDAAQGIEAQTLANLYLALENDLHIIPVLNKIDLPAAQPDKYAEEISRIIGCDPDDVLRISAKTGEGVPDVLNAICRDVPAPVGSVDSPARAMIFDSVYDSYRGVITYVRVFDGQLSTKDRGLMMSTQNAHEILEVGVVSPDMKPTEVLSAGEVGYVIPGVKNVRQARVGDTLTTVKNPATESLGGYQDAKPMVFSGLYPLDGSEYPALREALDKLRLNDAALVYEPSTPCASRPVRRSSSPTRATGRAARSPRSASPSPRRWCCCPATTSARSWSCARTGAACCRAWTTCPRTASSCATCSPWGRSSSTSSTS